MHTLPAQLLGCALVGVHNTLCACWCTQHPQHVLLEQLNGRGFMIHSTLLKHTHTLLKHTHTPSTLVPRRCASYVLHALKPVSCRLCSPALMLEVQSAHLRTVFSCRLCSTALMLEVQGAHRLLLTQQGAAHPNCCMQSELSRNR